LVPDGAFLRLVSGLYEVAVAPALWQGWLTQLCEILRAQVAVLVVRFERRVGDKGIFAVGIPDMTVEEIRRALRTSDILVEDGRLFDKALALEPGELVMLSEAVSNDAFVATRFYREWLQPRELHHLASLIVSRTPKQVTALTLLRKRESPRFADTELDLLHRLVPHLQRVIHIQEMLLGAELKLEVAEQMLESLGCGAILVDDTGHVYGTNPRAATLLERGEGLGLDRGRLRAEDPRETAALQYLVRSASEEAPTRSGGVLAVSRPARRSALVVSVSPLHGGERRMPWPPVAGALVLLSDPEELPVPGAA
jgi:PAS domain-containing protein